MLKSSFTENINGRLLTQEAISSTPFSVKDDARPRCIEYACDLGADENTKRINQYFQTLKTLGGGVLGIGAFPEQANFEVNDTLVIPDNCCLIGKGHKRTVIHMADGIDKNIVESEDFSILDDSNLWFDEEGVPTNIGIVGVTLIGTGNDAGHGIALYAKRYRIFDVYVYEAAYDGLYSGGAFKGGQSGLWDMPESDVDRFYVRLSGNNGITYKGPHDGRMGRVAISESGNWGVYTEQVADLSSGILNIENLHTYACARGNRLGARALVNTMETESNFGEGLVVESPQLVQINNLYSFNNNRLNGEGSFDLQFKSRTQVSNLYSDVRYGQTAIKVEAALQISSGLVEGNGSGEGVSLNFDNHKIDLQLTNLEVGARTLKSNRSSCIKLLTNNCKTGLLDTFGCNASRWDVSAVTADGQTGFVYSGVGIKNTIALTSIGTGVNPVSVHIEN